MGILPPVSSLRWPCLLLVVFSGWAYVAQWREVATADEPKFLEAGRYLTSQWDWEPAATTVHAPLSFYTHGLLLKPFTFASATTRLRAARGVMLLYAWGLGFAVYTWARTAHGPRAGLLALVLWAALPDTLAHAPLITTDIILACWVTWLGFAVWRFSVTGRWRWALAGGVALGLALLSKYSAALWVPGVVVLVLALTLIRRPTEIPARRMIAGLACLLLVGHVVLCLGYGGRGTFDAWGDHDWASGRFAHLAAHPLFARVPLLAPLPWLRGIDYAGANAQLGHPGFLLGRKFLLAPWYFQPVCLLLKLPTPFLVLLGLVGWATPRSVPVDWRGTWCLLGPPLFLLGYLMSFNRIAAGSRYVYPLLPALCIALSRCASSAVRLLPRVRQPVNACIALCVLTGIWSFPHYIAYTNLFSGGPTRAYRLLADSSLDWGQTRPPLRPDAVVNPGPIPVAGTILVNVNTFQDVFSRGAPHAWLHVLPVRAVWDSVWLELEGPPRPESLSPLLAALARGDGIDAKRLLDADPGANALTQRTALHWLALSAVEAGAPDAAELLRRGRMADVAEAHGLDVHSFIGEPAPVAGVDLDDPVARNNAGVAAFAAEHLEEAAEHFAAAIRLRPLMPAPYANLAVVEGARGQWRAALGRQQTFESIVTLSAARAFHPYRVYYGEQRVMLGDVLELWPRYTTEQLEAEIAWTTRPAEATGIARVRAYQGKNRLVEAGLALRDVESIAPANPAVGRTRAEWEAAVERLRRGGHVSS